MVALGQPMLYMGGEFNPERDRNIVRFEWPHDLSSHDLLCSVDCKDFKLYVLIPDDRKREMLAQLNRPAFSDLRDNVSYIVFSDCAAMWSPYAGSERTTGF